jgi:mono/diheme cytochrome c family protein
MLLLIVLAVAAGLAITLAMRPRIPAAERGRRLAERAGCFACHGPEGIRGAQNPGRREGTVPTWEGDVMMFAKSEQQVREWITDGATAERSRSESWRAKRAAGALKMPAFGRRLSKGQIDDLVAFVGAMHGAPEPADSLAAHGRERAEALGCVGCHGPGGRLARPNPGSFKGYVPAWDGDDFPELVSSRQEFGEWVERGRSRRMIANPLARFFLDRAVLHMPAYRDRLEPGDLDALWSYVQWSRSPAARQPWRAEDEASE